MAPRKTLVIGLDYGTTYTGVAYCERNDQLNVNDIQIVHDWPGFFGRGATKEKVPSEISYTPVDGGTEPLWGDQIPPGAQRKLWTKLELDERKKGDELQALIRAITGISNININMFRDSNAPPSYPGKEPVDIVADYLGKVREHLMTNLVLKYTREILRTMPVDLVITVPAVWSDKAKDATFKAVAKAGFDETNFPGGLKTTMVAEPEAAAIYALKTLRQGAVGEDIVVGDCFVLCDAGGGTVDLISYRVKSTSPTFQIEEAAVGTGDKCGGSFVDRNFNAWLEKKVGTENYHKISKPQSESDGDSEYVLEPKMGKILKEFIGSKVSFTGDPLEIYLPLPKPLSSLDNPSKGIVDGDVILTGKDFKEMFDPCVDKTLGLIEGQLRQVAINGSKAKFVILVGGFGKSPYLIRRVQEFCRLKGINVISPDFPWSAVVRGAVAKGLDGEQDLVYLRKCRRHYGTPVSEPFSSFKHSDEDSYIDDHDGLKYARGCMHWLISKGDPLLSAAPRTLCIEVYRSFKPTDSRIFKATLVACDDDVAPTRYAEDNARPIAVLSADMSSVPDSSFILVRNGLTQDPYYIANFKIELTITTWLNYRIVFQGKEVGSITASYDG